MHLERLFTLISDGHPLVAWGVLAFFFWILAKCADLFVDSAVVIAERLKIPKVVIGLVLVSLATTAPELTVSMMSALQGNPEMALGNAIGSVICNCGLALALCGFLSPLPIPVPRKALWSAGGFLIGISILTAVFVAVDNTLSSAEGAVLVALFFGYLGYLFVDHRNDKRNATLDLETFEDEKELPLFKQLVLFAVGVLGIVVSSKFIIVSATSIAVSFHIPQSVIALTLVALGTSIPEVATSITAARKGQGELAIGNILGANIMNVCWVAGASAMANELTLQRREILFMFPAMFIMVAFTLFFLKSGGKLSRREGLQLLVLYLLYLASFAVIFSVRG